jgi:HSP20 family protein
MNRLFESSLGTGRLEEAGFLQPGFSPPADVYETASGFVIEIELPGVSEQDVSLTAAGSEVTVRGERRLRGATRPECFHRMERTYGPFVRTFRLSAPIEKDAVKVRFQDGILRVDAPRLTPR